MASYKWPSVIPTSSLGITALTGDVTATGPGPAVATISSGVVTNAKLATMAAMSIKGNATGGIAAPTDLTSSQATAILAAMIGDSGSGGVKGLVPAPAAGDSAALKFLSAAGTWNIPAGTGGSGNVNGPSTSTANAISTYADATGTLLLDTDTSVISGGGFTSFGTVVNALNLQSATNTYFIGKELQITTVLGSSTTITNLSANQALEFDSVSDLNVLATNTLGLSGNATNIGANTSVVISAGNASVDIQAATSVNLSPTQTLNLQSGAGFDIALAPGAGGIADVTGNLRASNLISDNIKGDNSPNLVKINNELSFTGDSGGSQISTAGSSLNIAPLSDLFLNTSSGANMALNSAGTMSLASTTTFDILASDAISITTAVAAKSITIQSSGQLLLTTLTAGSGNDITIRPVSGQPIILDSFSLFKEQSAPGTGPSITAGYGSFYAGNNGSPYYKNAAGTVTKLDSFQAPITIGALDAQAANSTGLALVANVLSTQSADATHPGMVNTTTQTIAGAKTFSGGITATVTGTASGNTTYTPNNHGVVISTATNAMTVIAPDASTAKALFSGGLSADPTWQSAMTNPMTTIGDLVYASNTATPATAARLPLGTANQVAGVTGSGTIPAYRTVNETNTPNYIVANPNANVDTAGWVTYADAAANIPVDGTGGTATNLTFSRSTSSPLRGAGQFSMVQANSTSLQGKGVSYDFTIDAADKARVLSIQFDYNASSTFVASNGITAPLNDGTTTTNAGNSDVEVFIYDVTNTILIPVSPQVIVANGTNNFQFKGTFQTASNSASYRLIFHIATTSANATGWTFLFDNLFVGAQPILQGGVITDWVAYTPGTFTGFGSPTSVSAYSRRNGDSLEFQMKFTAGTTAGSTGAISLGYNGISGNVTIDTTKISATTVIGTGAQNNSASTFFGLVTLATGANTTFAFGQQTSTAGAITAALGTAITTGANVTFCGKVPIVGWSSTTVMSNDTDTRIVAASYYVSSNFTASTTIPVNFDTKIYDTHGAITTSATAWKFTAPVSGIYNVGGMFTISTAVGCRYTIYKNGIALQAIMDPANATYASAPNTNISLVAGDYIDIRLSSSLVVIGGSLGTTDTTVISIYRLSGPAAIAVTDSVNARYYASSTSLSGSLATIVWTTKDYDTHNAMSSGVYTVPVSGAYHVNTNVQVTGTIALNNQLDAQIQKNGTAVSEFQTYAGGAMTAQNAQLSDIIKCVAGDTIRLQILSSATLPAITASNTKVFFSISRVGN